MASRPRASSRSVRPASAVGARGAWFAALALVAVLAPTSSADGNTVGGDGCAADCVGP